MRIARFQTSDGICHQGWINEDMAGLTEGNIFAEFRRLEANLPLDKLKLLAPVLPGKIICVGRNYEEHATEQDVEIPEFPLLFLKPPSAIIGPGDDIVLPPQSNQVEHEAELAVVIGKRGRWISVEDVNQYTYGYTIANDVTARDLQRKDGQWTRGKGFDTFCPVGPWIETSIDAADTLITCKVNSELRQMSSTKEMIFSIDHLVSYISNCMTLEPGDLILTGTPAGVGPIEDGDIIQIEIEGIGILNNSVSE